MIQELKYIEKNHIVALLSDSERFKTVDVDYHPPKVERIWCQLDDKRLSFHYIHPCESHEALYHPHSWASAMHVIEGTYEMGLSYGLIPDGQSKPTLQEICKLEVSNGMYYQMVHQNGYHYVRPVNDICKTVMLSGPPWYKGEKATKTLDSLSQERANEIRLWFLNYYMTL